MIEDVAIGVLDGPEELIFGEVSRLAEDREGGVYVFDDQGPEIRRFDRTGAFLGPIGRTGEGPGEYKRLSLGMVVDSAGVLYVHDWGNGRLLRFDAEANPLDSWELPSTFLTTRPGTWLYSDAPGRLMVTTRLADRSALLVVEGGRMTDTLEVPELPGMPVRRGGPYRVDTYWSWHPDGYFVVGVSDEYSFEARRPDGVLRIIRDVEGTAVHPEEADAWRRYFEWMDRQPQSRAPEGEWIPATMPPFRRIDVGRDGRIWIRRNARPIRIAVDESLGGPPPIGWEQPSVYDVFEPDGAFLGEIRFSDRFEPHVFGSGYVWGVRSGDLDEEYVVRLSIVSEDGGGA